MNRTEKNKELAKKQEKLNKKEKRERKTKILKKIFIKLFILIALIFIYSRYIEPNILVVHETIISSDKVSSSMTITHFSDLHYGMTINSKNINNIINKINLTKPDIVVFTGDLIDSDYKMTSEDIKILKESLKKINAKISKYSIYGNHDYNDDFFDEIMKEANFDILINESDTIHKKDEKLLIYGLDDIALGIPDISKLKEVYNENTYTIVLMHETDYITTFSNDYNIDLVLSGHSHNGQINIPYFGPLYLPKDSKVYYKPYYKVNNSELYISNGIGTSLYKLRFLSVPSINVYRLKKVD